jgi:hypothetical protein
VFDALPAMRAARPHLPVIVMSAQSTVSTALSAAGAGAYDYVPKPFDLDALMAAVRRALAGGPDAKARAQASKAEKEERLPLIGRSPAMQDVYRIMARVAGSDLTVLVEGESGAGKERVARAIHEHSRRAAGPFVTISLAGAAASQLDRDLVGCYFSDTLSFNNLYSRYLRHSFKPQRQGVWRCLCLGEQSKQPQLSLLLKYRESGRQYYSYLSGKDPAGTRRSPGEPGTA